MITFLDAMLIVFALIVLKYVLKIFSQIRSKKKIKLDDSTYDYWNDPENFN